MESYPFEFVGIDKTVSDEYQIESLIYRFESSKSSHRYLVRIEHYANGLYCVKFFDDTQSDYVGKFSHLSSTFEVRTILHTIVNICLDVLNRDPLASFMYIGAADRKDTEGLPTRRFRVYRMLLAEYNITMLFDPYNFFKHSMSILVSLRAMPTEAQRSAFRKEIREFIGILDE